MRSWMRTLTLVSLTALAGCSTPGYRSLNPNCLSPDAQPKYQRDGHQDTTYIVARLAGWTPEHAATLAFYNQAADDLALRYAAPEVSVWASFGGWRYRHRINSVLHSLHGGDPSQVMQRRADLAAQIADRGQTGAGADWQTGFLIHALGDSFAHTDENGAAYDELYGHLFDGHGPDLVGLRRDLYLDYVDTLYRTLERPGSSDPDLLAAFRDRILAVEDGDVAAHAAAIRSMRDTLPEAPRLACDALAERLSMGGVSRFLAGVEAGFGTARSGS